MRIDKPILIALILFITVLLAYFLVFPAYQKFKELQTELGIKQAEYNAEFDYYSSITRTYYDLKSYEEDVKIVDDALPSDPSFGRLIYYFQEQSSESGLILRDLFLSKSSGSSSKSAVKSLTFSLTLIGNYSSLENFLASLEKSAKLFEVTSISFGSGNASSQGTQFRTQNIFTFSLQVNTYIY
jgi:Tfp pilus assembly protein PilO